LRPRCRTARIGLKRSARVQLSLVSTLASAALLAGCGSKPAQAEGWQTCVDHNKGVAVEQHYCDEDRARAGGQPGYVPLYSWYYYPHGLFSSASGLGMPVPVGGTYSAMPFTSIPTAHSGSVTRGGFGSTAAGHASTGA
jgi:hypothetical protein